MSDRDAIEGLHARIVTGEPTATADLFAAVHAKLTRTIRKNVGRAISWEEAADTATDAIVAYANDPGRFDPARGRLFGYLLVIARGDALNAARDTRTERKNVTRLVELSAADGKSMEEAPDVTLDAARIIRDHHAAIVRDDGDDAVLRLYLHGERDTAEYATALKIAHLPAAEQRRIVKTRKDRIEQRLKRLREGLK